MFDTQAPGIMTSENWIASLPEAARQEVAERMTILELCTGDTLKAIGDTATGMHQVAAGYLRLMAPHVDGKQTLIVIYGPGNCLSESPLVARRPVNHAVIAHTDARVSHLAAADFWDLYHRHPSIPDALCRKFAGNITRLLARRELNATYRLRAMLGFVFLNLVDHCGEAMPDGSIMIRLPLTQHDLADHLNVTRQGVQREIGALKKVGTIAKENGFWRITDIERLKQETPIEIDQYDGESLC